MDFITELMNRYPHIADDIFSRLTLRQYETCLEVCAKWRSYLTEHNPTLREKVFRSSWTSSDERIRIVLYRLSEKKFEYWATRGDELILIEDDFVRVYGLNSALPRGAFKIPVRNDDNNLGHFIDCDVNSDSIVVQSRFTGLDYSFLATPAKVLPLTRKDDTMLMKEGLTSDHGYCILKLHGGHCLKLMKFDAEKEDYDLIVEMRTPHFRGHDFFAAEHFVAIEGNFAVCVCQHGRGRLASCCGNGNVLEFGLLDDDDSSLCEIRAARVAKQAEMGTGVTWVPPS